ncbi:MAG: shikimate dehydrogenase [Ilumatobacteraceae bacterium]
MSRRPISGHTRVAAVLGWPIEHSLSPAIHNAGFESLDVDWTYVALPTPPERLGSVLDLCRGGSIAGASVTMPLKTLAYESMDHLTDAARVLRSVNTVSMDDGLLIGHSTDGDGLVDALLEEAVSLVGVSVFLLGWGGAARSVADAVKRAGADRVLITNRSGTDADELHSVVPDSLAVPWSERDDVCSEIDIVINCTSVGMGGDPSLPLDPSRLEPSTTVVDLVYHPLDTPFMVSARRHGCRVVGGLGMLVHQAARQQEIWLGRRPDTSIMKAQALQALAERR